MVRGLTPHQSSDRNDLSATAAWGKAQSSCLKSGKISLSKKVGPCHFNGIHQDTITCANLLDKVTTHRPDVIILDEPTVGLDPIQIKEIRALIRELAQDHGVILSTHILPEVQMTCDRVQIINHGQLVYSDDIDHLHQRMRSNSIILGLNNAPAESELQALEAIDDVEVLTETRFRLSHHSEKTPAENIAQVAAQKNWGLYELRPEQKTLEQVFVELTSGEVIPDEADAEERGATAA